MQKKIIALAIAAAFSAPAFADDSNITIYGKLNLNIESVHNNLAAAPNSVNRIVNNASRLGFKGSEDLGDGLSAIWQMEAQFNPSGTTATGPFDGTRNSNVGLKGDFGTVFLGNWDTPYKSIHNKVELFDNAGSFTAGKLIGVTGNAKSYVTRQASVVQYWTPNMSGFQGMLSFTPGTKTATTNPTRISLSGTYENDMFYTALGYESRPDQTTAGENDNATRLVGMAKLGAGQIGLTYEHMSTGTASGISAGQNNLEISGKYKIGSSTIGALYAKNGNLGAVAASGAKMFSLRYGYNLSKRTELWAAYSTIKNDTAAKYGFFQGTAVAGSTDSGFGMGLSHSF
ncbi:MAG: porin [Gallionella sp.]|nr:porin [Gallionella sp.]